MIILGIETSCDETSIGIVRNGSDVLVNIIYSQIKEHESFAGVVPEIASRLHLEKINFLFQQALHKIKIPLEKIDIIAVTTQPGLVGSLMIGASFAKTLALFLNKPIIAVNHLIAHLYANFLKPNPPQFPYIGLIVSGGHTLLLIAESHFKYKIIGTTLDDAVGEAYDKTAKLLNLGYPGGPLLDKMAKSFKGHYISFSSGLKNSKKNKYNFSYSGLKTAVLYHTKKYPQESIKKIVKGFQVAAITILFEKTLQLVQETGIREIVIAGGVAANSYLRELFLNEKNIKVHIPDITLCTDNGAMIAAYAYYYNQLKQYETLEFDVASKPKGGPVQYLEKGFN